MFFNVKKAAYLCLVGHRVKATQITHSVFARGTGIIIGRLLLQIDRTERTGFGK